MEKEWFSKLTEEQKEKLSQLEGGTDALITFCKEEKLDLPDDLLEAVSGGRGNPCFQVYCTSYNTFI